MYKPSIVITAMRNNLIHPGVAGLHPFRCALLIMSVVFCNASLMAQLQPALADSFLHFIVANPAKAAVYISRNDTTVAQLNQHQLMPLASTVKILVAIEFAKQAGNGTIDENEYVSLQTLNKYFLPFTDGGAHPRWIAQEQLKKHVREDSIRLIDVARGMIMFSSNANTEYLGDRLGLDNINRNRALFGLKKHTPVYPMVSALFLYQRPANLTEEEVLAGIRKLSVKQYVAETNRIHQQLTSDSTFKSTFTLLTPSLLPATT